MSGSSWDAMPARLTASARHLLKVTQRRPARLVPYDDRSARPLPRQQLRWESRGSCRYMRVCGPQPIGVLYGGFSVARSSSARRAQSCEPAVGREIPPVCSIAVRVAASLLMCACAQLARRSQTFPSGPRTCCQVGPVSPGSSMPALRSSPTAAGRHCALPWVDAIWLCRWFQVWDRQGSHPLAPYSTCDRDVAAGGEQARARASRVCLRMMVPVLARRRPVRRSTACTGCRGRRAGPSSCRPVPGPNGSGTAPC
jgi:hypothetical protein